MRLEPLGQLKEYLRRQQFSDFCLRVEAGNRAALLSCHATAHPMRMESSREGKHVQMIFAAEEAASA